MKLSWLPLQQFTAYEKASKTGGASWHFVLKSQCWLKPKSDSKTASPVVSGHVPESQDFGARQLFQARFFANPATRALV